MVTVNPLHLATMVEICKIFKKSRKTVKRWYVDGAPIVFDGGCYSAEYNALQNWLLQKSK